MDRSLLLETVRPYYMEPFRAYHDLSHPTEMFADAERLGVRLTDAQAVAVAFHDVVNAAGLPPGTNEIASAGVLRAYAAHLGLDAGTAAEAAAIVEATDHSGRQAPETADIVLDLDLARLALDWPGFVGMSKAVHVEWRHLVPDYRDFMRGRAAFFAGMAKRPRIFRTDLFDESAARSNLERFAVEWR